MLHRVLPLPLLAALALLASAALAGEPEAEASPAAQPTPAAPAPAATEAPVGVQAMLGLVEPQSSGVAGGAFLLYYDAHLRKVSAVDGRERAPAGVQPHMFLDEHGKA